MNSCRICLGDENLTNIFSIDNVAESIMHFADVKVEINDGLPQYICLLCKHELDICVQFKDKCESTYHILYADFQKNLNSEPVVLNAVIGGNSENCLEPTSKKRIRLTTRPKSTSKFEIMLPHTPVNEEPKVGEYRLTNFITTGCVTEESSTFTISMPNSLLEGSDSPSESRLKCQTDLVTEHSSINDRMEPRLDESEDESEIIDVPLKSSINDIMEPRLDESEIIDVPLRFSRKYSTEDFKETTEIEIAVDNDSVEENLDAMPPTNLAHNSNADTPSDAQINDDDDDDYYLHEEYLPEDTTEEGINSETGQFSDTEITNSYEKDAKSVGINSCPRCPNCDFDNELELNRHIEIVHRDTMTECQICMVYFPDEKTLTDHLERKHDIVVDEINDNPEKEAETINDTLTCSLCLAVFEAETDVQEHICPKLSQFFCKRCDLYFVSQIILETHTEKYHKEYKFKCSECLETFGQYDQLELHKNTHVPAVKPVQVCSICSKKFKTAKALKLHLKNHINEQEWVCEECDKSYTCENDLINHSVVVHDKNVNEDKCLKTDMLNGQQINEKSDIPKSNNECQQQQIAFTCPHCQKTFKSNRGVHCHMRTHEELKPFKCLMCKQSFRTSNELKAHTILHEEKHMFKCTECDESFLRKRGLDVHKLIHENLVTYKKIPKDELTSTNENGSLEAPKIKNEAPKHTNDHESSVKSDATTISGESIVEKIKRNFVNIVKNQAP